jgi:hypothetical protein
VKETKPKPDGKLSQEAEDFAEEFKIEDTPGQLLLRQAGRYLDMGRAAQAQIAEQGLLVTVGSGNPKPNPMLKVERLAWVGFTDAMRMLHLETNAPAAWGGGKRHATQAHR